MITPPPDATTGRQSLPDQIRGIALLGIALVNMPFLAISISGFTPDSISSIPDRVTAFMIVALAQGKFYLLFAFLFGYSLTLLLRQRTVDGVGRFRRRLIGLAVVGIAHAVLFFIGDILFSYAILGALVLLFAARSDRAALRGGVVFFGIALTVLVVVAISAPAGSAGLVADSSGFDTAIRGSFITGAAARAAVLPEALVVQVVLNWSFSLCMFLLGMVAGRRGVLSHPEQHTILWRRLLLLAGFIGVPGGLLAAWLSFGPGASTGQGDLLAVAIGFGTAPALAAGYVALLALHTASPILRAVQPAGRMSLTGYLGESIVMAAIFCGWGFGLFGRLGAFHAALIAFAVWLALDLSAILWLRRYRYGPFEWALRAWSYRALPTMRTRRSEGPEGHGRTGRSP